MTRRLRAGLIGCGRTGEAHSDCVGKLEGMDMAAFCDLAREKAETSRQKYGGEYATDEPDVIFRDKSIDAVYICTHHDSHAALCLKGAEAGKHMLVEKPLALTLGECREISRAVQDAGVKLMTAFKMRYFDLVLKTRELIPEPLVVTMQMMDNRWGDGLWANDPVKGGGNVLSQGCHSCDILRFVAGSDPVDVYAAGRNFYQASGVIDNLCAVFRFDSGGIGNWVQGDCQSPAVTSKFFMQVFAEGKSAVLNDRFCTLTYQEGAGEPRVFRGSETGMMEENRAFIHCLRNDTRPPIDERDGLLATLMVLQAFQSLRTGRPEPIASVLDG